MRLLSQATSVRTTLPRFIRPTAHVPVVIFPAIDAPERFSCHRYQKRTVPCLEPPCPFCAAEIPFDPRVYVPGWHIGAKKFAVVDATLGAYDQLLFIVERLGPLRGTRISFARAEPFDNAPMAITGWSIGDKESHQKPFADFHRVLDQMLASNADFALAGLGLPKMADAVSPVLNDRGVT